VTRHKAVLATVVDTPQSLHTDRAYTQTTALTQAKVPQLDISLAVIEDVGGL
jgi:hypothetical protein